MGVVAHYHDHTRGLPLGVEQRIGSDADHPAGMVILSAFDTIQFHRLAACQCLGENFPATVAPSRKRAERLADILIG